MYGTTDIGEFCGGVYDGVYEKNYYPVNNTINIDIHGGTFNSVYGGGLNDWVVGKETTVRNGIQLNIENATIKGSVYLAGKYGSIDGNSTLRIINSKINDSVYAGGQGGTNRAGHVIQSDVRGNMTMYIDENTTIDNNVFLGGNILSTTTGKVILDFYGKAQNIYGGGNGASTSIQGDTKIIINNTAVISGSIYGGGEFGMLIGNSQIDILGGRIGSAEIENSGNIFGGGNNIGVTTSTINVKGTSDIYGNIYGGSNTTGMTTTSNVNIAGTVTNNVYAGGKGSGTTVTTADLNIEVGTATGALWQRSHYPATPSGNTYIRSFEKYIAAHGNDMKVYTDMDAVSLIQDKAGRVIGVVAKDNHTGKTTKFMADKGVILATGGFGANFFACCPC